MAINPTEPVLWETPSGPCGRPTKVGTLCPAGRASASVYAGIRMVWESPACMTHLDQEEREARQAAEDRLTAAAARLAPACWSWPLPTTEDLSAFDTSDDWGALVVNDDEADFLRSLCPNPDSVGFEAFHNGRCAICGRTDRLVRDPRSLHRHDPRQPLPQLQHPRRLQPPPAVRQIPGSEPGEHPGGCRCRTPGSAGRTACP